MYQSEKYFFVAVLWNKNIKNSNTVQSHFLNFKRQPYQDTWVHLNCGDKIS